MLLNQFIKENTKLLKLINCDAPRTDVLVILEHILDKDRSWIIAHDDYELKEIELIKLNNLIKKRTNHEPLSYILGYKEFYGRQFEVNENVLIPRPESENIIEMAKKLKCNKFIDIGTGSGCLAISVSLESLNSEVYAVDVSKNAILLAEKNAKTLGANVKFIESDLLEELSEEILNSSCLLVNLPYVPNNLITSEEINKEPKLALFSGNDGMDLYTEFWLEIKKTKLKPSYIITESLKDQHTEMTKLAINASFSHQETRDLIQLFKFV